MGVGDLQVTCKFQTDSTWTHRPALLLMASTETAERRYGLITRRLQEVLGGDLIKGILADGRTPKCYWGAYTSIQTYGLH